MLIKKNSDLIIFVNPHIKIFESGEVGQIIAKKLCKIYRVETLYQFAKKYVKILKKKNILFSRDVIISDYI